MKKEDPFYLSLNLGWNHGRSVPIRLRVILAFAVVGVLEKEKKEKRAGDAGYI